MTTELAFISNVMQPATGGSGDTFICHSKKF